MIPAFAVLGHPNEGKSSVVSTLTENDAIPISRIPGETVRAKDYIVKIDGTPVIKFIDTPGFQVPRQTLAWFKQFKGKTGDVVTEFIDTYQHDPFYQDECELFKPVDQGAGIIYVVDGSRPVRDDDLCEMEILRLTGRPRMAVINAKTDAKDYSKDWQQEFRKHFNAIRIFNSNTANFLERIRMLESLKSIDQEWEPMLSSVVQVFETDWEKRNRMAAATIIAAIEQSLTLTVSEPLSKTSYRRAVEKQLSQKYQSSIRSIEKKMFKRIRSLYKHHLFDYQLDDYSVLKHDLFSEKTWELLGLTSKQLAVAGAVVGGTMGVVLDAAVAGHSLGFFAAVGGIIGAGSAIFSGKKIAGETKSGIQLGGDKLNLGPNKNLQFLYILMDRACIYYAHMVKRPHGKRDGQDSSMDTGTLKRGFTTTLTKSQQQICARFFKAANRRFSIKDKEIRSDFYGLIMDLLKKIAH